MTRLKLSENFSYRVVDDEAFILNVSSGDYLRLNCTATALFKVVCEGGTLEEAVDRLSSKFEFDPESASADAVELIESLIQRKVLIPDQAEE